MIRHAVLAAVLSAFVAAPAFAATPQSGPVHIRPLRIREHRLEQRIRRGVNRDEITKADADKLRSDEARIREAQRTFRHSAQGLTPADRRDLGRQLKQTRREIARVRHHRRTAGGR